MIKSKFFNYKQEYDTLWKFLGQLVTLYSMFRTQEFILSFKASTFGQKLFHEFLKSSNMYSCLYVLDEFFSIAELFRNIADLNFEISAELSVKIRVFSSR